MNKAMNKKNQAGFSLIETGVAIAIGAIVISLALLGAGPVRASYKSSNESTTIQSMINMTKTFKSAGSYGTTTLLPAILAGGQVLGSMTVGGTTAAPTLTNQFSGAVTVVGATSNFVVTTVGEPANACIKLSIDVASSDASVATKVGSTTFVAGVVPTASQAATACATAANTIVWTVSG